jgi:hypothetical protein
MELNEGEMNTNSNLDRADWLSCEARVFYS